MVDKSGWIMFIVKHNGWNPVYDCPSNECIIEALPEGYGGFWNVGEIKACPEVNIKPLQKKKFSKYKFKR